MRNAWLNNFARIIHPISTRQHADFAGLDSDADPLFGQHEGPGKSGMNPPTFTIPAPPLRHRCTGIRRFATVKGSGYFLMPSISDVARLGRGEFGTQAEPPEPPEPSDGE